MFAISYFALATQPLALADIPYQPEQIYKLEQIQDHIGRDLEDVLVIFDVDDVLVTSKDAFIHPECNAIFKKIVRRELAKATTPEEKEKFECCLSISLLKSERSLVEASTPDLIRQIQKAGVKTIALTSCPTGKFGIVPKVEHWRIDQLQKLGIDFSGSFAALDGTSFSEVPQKEVPCAHPLFEKGILFSYGYSKGEVLEAFLARAKWKPSKIIFVDDLLENHQSLHQCSQTLGVPFLGFHYLGAELSPEKIDVDLIEFQFNHLMQHQEWLSDEKISFMKEMNRAE
jgi:hypothetical protein